MSKIKLIVYLILIYILSVLLIWLVLFIPAWSLKFWQGWLFMVSLFWPTLFTGIYLYKYDPQLLERRLRYKEKVKQQQIIITISNIVFFIWILVPWLDYRYGWSNVPFWLVILSNILIIIWYIIIFLVFKQNTYSWRTIEIDKWQKVITTWLYAIVRHPMYSWALLMYLSIPTALWSYYAIPFFLPIIPILVLRLLNEEKVLMKGLTGYKEYCQKTIYRLLPKIW